MSFFDTTPIGRIINRFSSDLYAIDDSLPFQLNIFLAQIFGILGTLVVTCYGLPWFTLTLVPLGFVYYRIQVRLYMKILFFIVLTGKALYKDPVLHCFVKSACKALHVYPALCSAE